MTILGGLPGPYFQWKFLQNSEGTETQEDVSTLERYSRVEEPQQPPKAGRRNSPPQEPSEGACGLNSDVWFPELS